MFERLRSAIAAGVKEYHEFEERARRKAQMMEELDPHAVVRQLDPEAPSTMTIKAFLADPDPSRAGLFVAAITGLATKLQIQLMGVATKTNTKLMLAPAFQTWAAANAKACAEHFK